MLACWAEFLLGIHTNSHKISVYRWRLGNDSLDHSNNAWEKREAFLQEGDRTHGEPQLKRCYVQGNLHPEEQKNTHMIIFRHVAEEQNMSLLIKKLKFKQVTLNIIKFLAEDMSTFFYSCYYILLRDEHLKFGCIWFQSVLKDIKKKAHHKTFILQRYF